MAEKKDRLAEFEKKHGVEIFIHIILRYGKKDINVYGIIDNKAERGESISAEALWDLNIFLVREYYNFSERAKTFFAKKKFKKFPLKELKLSITINEILDLQESERKMYALANSCY